MRLIIIIYLVPIYFFKTSIASAQYEAKAFCVKQIPGFSGYDIDTKTGLLRGSNTLGRSFGSLNDSKINNCIKNYKNTSSETKPLIIQQSSILPSDNREPAKGKVQADKPKADDEGLKKPETAEAKARADKAAKEAEIERLAALEVEKQKQKVIAEAKEKLEREKEIERLAALEIEKKRVREEKEAAIKAEAIRLAAIEAENKRLREEAEARARAQRIIELENELKKLRADTSQVKPTAQQRQENIKTDNDPLTVFEGTWVSVNPPVFYLIFNKVALGIRQVSLPNIGQGNIRLSDGAHGSNFQISAANLNCYYFVTFTNNRQKMVMELKAGENLCLQSSVLEKAE